jgi:hypothetical protein
MKIKSIIIVLLTSCGLVALLLLLPDKSRVLDDSKTSKENTFPKRLRNTAEDQDSIIRSLIDNLPATIGARREDLDPTHQDLLTSLAKQQGEIQDEVSNILVDLIQYHSSDRHEVYEEVLLSIQESKIDVEFDQIQELILKNQPFSAVESAKACSERLHNWSEQLDKAHLGKEKKPNKP